MKLIRKLIVGISTICLLVITFVSSTYAWFQINSRASVENFHFEVHGGQGFLVSIDNVNYYNDLNLLQLQKAMLVAYGDGKYKIANDGSEKLYEIRYEDGLDSMGNPAVLEIEEELEAATIAKRVSDNIKLLPTTSWNGRDLTDMYNSPSDVSLGRFLQFSIYFRTQSRRVEDHFAYDIYLNGDDATTDDGSLVEPTRITSDPSIYNVSADMDAVIDMDKDGIKRVYALKRNNTQGQRDAITVYSSNAIRLSITENILKEYTITNGENEPTKEYRYEVTDENATKIYELNDTVNKNTDLGSYATDYTGGYTEGELDAMITEQGTLIEDEKLALYCSRFNAMYTYYNNIKPDAQIEHISYADRPKTIRDLSTKDTITRVVAGEEAKLLTFRLWLEGWDADCFDGIEYAVKVRLAFGSKRVEL